MSYNFTVGNAVPEFDKEDGILSARWVVECKTHPDAPTFPNDEMTGNGNQRSPSYSGWADWCREVGLYDFFYDERGHLHAGHPGCVLITEADWHRVKSSLLAWQAKATLPPGFYGWPKFDEKTQTHKCPGVEGSNP